MPFHNSGDHTGQVRSEQHQKGTCCTPEHTNARRKARRTTEVSEAARDFCATTQVELCHFLQPCAKNERHKLSGGVSDFTMLRRGAAGGACSSAFLLVPPDKT